MDLDQYLWQTHLHNGNQYLAEVTLIYKSWRRSALITFFQLKYELGKLGVSQVNPFHNISQLYEQVCGGIPLCSIDDIITIIFIYQNIIPKT